VHGQTFVNSVKTNQKLVVVSSDVDVKVPTGVDKLEVAALGERIVVFQPFSHRLLFVNRADDRPTHLNGEKRRQDDGDEWTSP